MKRDSSLDLLIAIVVLALILTIFACHTSYMKGYGDGERISYCPVCRTNHP